MSRSQSMARSFDRGAIRSTRGLPVVNPHAAGADIGAQHIFVCIPGPDQAQIVRAFGTYTADLHTLANWLVENGIQTIATESTGVYWIPHPSNRGLRRRNRAHLLHPPPCLA